MTKTALISVGVIIALAVISAIVYYFYFSKGDSKKNKISSSPSSGTVGEISSVFDDFFRRMDEKYQIKSSKPAVQFLELMVGNSLKIAEGVLDLPDIKWALENKTFDGVNIPAVNNSISPVFDCIKTKIDAIGKDPTLKTTWDASDLQGGFDDVRPVFMEKLTETFVDNINSCITSELTNQKLTGLRTQYNAIANNMNSTGTPMAQLQSNESLKDTLNSFIQSSFTPTPPPPPQYSAPPKPTLETTNQPNNL